MELGSKYVHITKKAVEYFSRGSFKLRLKEYEFAIKDFDNAIKISPDFAEAYYKRGDAKSLKGNHGEAISDYNTAISIILNKY
jgi:tetratricopeptide (TPR) repeat protein